jgi:tripartite-type tricarboxylate transporter receptor subunit TctC
VPYGPGSGNDVIARIVAKKIGDNWGYSIVVVNRAGATGGIALELTANAPADAHAIVIASTSQIINQHLSKVRYDFLRDFTPVALSGSLPYAVSVLKSFPVGSVKELVALARAHPGKMNFTGTVGSIAHFMGEMLKSAGGIDIVMIPNKLAAEADVLAGGIEIWFATLSTTLRQARPGKVKVLAVSGEQRSAELPNVPTMAQAGYPQASVVAGYFILAPAGTPKPIVDMLNGEIVRAIGDKEVRERLAAAGVEPTSSTPQELGALLKSEVARWEKIVKASGIRLE